jgi:hypothetical protein
MASLVLRNIEEVFGGIEVVELQSNVEHSSQAFQYVNGSHVALQTTVAKGDQVHDFSHMYWGRCPLAPSG